METESPSPKKNVVNETEGIESLMEKFILTFLKLAGGGENGIFYTWLTSLFETFSSS